MKKYIIKAIFTISFLGILSFNGCILDAFNTLTQNIPISQEFDVSSSATSYTRTETIDLSSSTTYQRFQDKINSIKFVRAEYRTKSVNPANLTGTITVTISDMSGNLIFTTALNQVKPGDYINTPYELSLNSTQIGLFNSYLSSSSNRQFKVAVSITNISPTPYNLIGIVDVVFEMNADT